MAHFGFLKAEPRTVSFCGMEENKGKSNNIETYVFIFAGLTSIEWGGGAARFGLRQGGPSPTPPVRSQFAQGLHLISALA